MTIQEILEAHRLLRVSHLPLTHEYCNCNEVFENKEAHRAHVAEVLDKHMREREAEAWEMGQDSVALHHDIFGASLEYEANPYRKDTSNGR